MKSFMKALLGGLIALQAALFTTSELVQGDRIALNNRVYRVSPTAFIMPGSELVVKCFPCPMTEIIDLNRDVSYRATLER